MIIKTEDDLTYLKESGRICSLALKTGISSIKSDISTLEINNIVESVILDNGGKPAFLGYNAGEGPYPFATCVCINHQLVHAIPQKNVIVKKGDLVTIDVGVNFKGLITDSSNTIEVETNNEQFFLNTGRRALKAALKQAVALNHVEDISYEMQKEVEGAGFNVSLDLVGHGVGKKLHEEPQIPCYGRKGRGALLTKGLVIAIEIMYMKGKPTLVLGEDGFSFDTKDKSLSAQIEHTVVVTDKEPLILV